MQRDLLSTWSNWEPDSPPFILEEDRTVLTTARSTIGVTTTSSWREAYSASDFGTPGDTKLHLGLLPHPFCGNVRDASVYVLLLNPGLGPHDYYGEYEVPDYRQAALNNLRQEFTESVLPFFLLDPQFSWHGGFDWWHGKFEKVIGEIAEARGESFASARKFLGNQLASIELVPYHSTSYRDRGGWLKHLHSVKLARQFVREYVLPKVEREEAIVVVTRQVAAWNLSPQTGVTLYTGQQARAAHLTPSSPGGKAILNRLLATSD